ncbi:MAG TPA: PIN domain-containing protein [Pseudonocardia sp.]
MTVLDAYAVIAYLRGEPAAEEVAELLRAGSTLATANAAEVIDQMVRVWERPADDVEGDLAVLSATGLRVCPLDTELAVEAGRLRAVHYHRATCAVSMADCVAAVTALRLDEPLATADPALAAVVRAEAGRVVGLADSRSRRP